MSIVLPNTRCESLLMESFEGSVLASCVFLPKGPNTSLLTIDNLTNLRECSIINNKVTDVPCVL